MCCVLLRAAVVVGRSGVVRALVGRVGDACPCRCRDPGNRRASSKPSLSSGSFGHLSSASAMPSVSLSGSGQPSSSSNLSLSSGSFGHLSLGSRMPSLSLSGSGQPSSSSKPSLSSGSVGTLVDVVEDAVVVAIARRLGGAAQRQVVRLARVAVGDADVIAGAEVVALIQLVRRELDVGLGQRQLARRAVVGAAVARFLGDRAHLAHVRLELQAGAATHREAGTMTATRPCARDATRSFGSAVRAPYGSAFGLRIRLPSAGRVLPARSPASPGWTYSPLPPAWRRRWRALDSRAPRPFVRTRSRPGTRRIPPLRAPCAGTPRRPCIRRARSDPPARAWPTTPPTPLCCRPG